ncbi:unnamed protein product, partial [Mesorhabditis spiculigera]
MHRLGQLLLLLPSLLHASVQFDNSLTGSPKIQCEHGAITLDVSTEKGAPSYVFAKNHFNKEGCSYRNSTHVTFNFDRCNVNRKREVQPKRGMSYSLTVMVQLHPLFITKVDRAYHVHCFYMETDKSVGTQMNVNELPPQTIDEEMEAPVCQYTLHKDSINGPNVQRVKVGDPIYHVWECPTDAFAMLIHSCVVYDGQSGNQVPVIDENGCSLDPFLMPELTYSKELTKTFTPSSAFNFPDIQQVYFNCKIKLCPLGPNESNDCSGITPPRCGANAKANIISAGTNALDDFNPQRPISESKETVDSSEKKTVDEELSTEHLIPTANSAKTTVPEATHVQTTVHDVTDGKTTIVFQTTTSLPPVTTTRSSSTTTRAPTTQVIRAEKPFPTPAALNEFSAKKYNDTEIVDEGSGLEISSEHDVPTIKVLAGDKKPTAKAGPRREIKRRDTPPTVDVDIASPELTVLDRDYDLPEPLGQQGHLMSTSAPAGPPAANNNVCLPMFSIWALVLLLVLCLSLLTIAVCRTCARRDKFMPY